MTLVAYKKRASADRCGLRRIWDQARAELEPLELVRLAEHLESTTPVTITDKAGHRRRAESPFKLTRSDRRSLALALRDVGISDRRIAYLAGISERTWRRLRTDTSRQAIRNGLNKGENRTVSGHREQTAPSAILSFSAAGTEWTAHRQIQDALGLGSGS